MKIALLTIWHEKNYGAELQAYATVKVLQNLGHKVEMIDIRLSDMVENSIKHKVATLISMLGQGERAFNSFWKCHIPTTRRYNNTNELQNNPPKADVYIVGSDQVWNPDITKDFAKLFFLNFGDKRIYRISYASSFGKDSWNHPELKPFVRKQFSQFYRISCREESGVNLLKKEFEVTAQSVADPTLLLDNYSELTGPLIDTQTLVYYPLSRDEELETYSLQLAQRLALTPVNNNKKELLLGRLPWKRTSIEEWVRNIAQAQFVITRSFHGLVFCLLYKRQFAILASRNGRGDRLINLLKAIGLEERYYANTEAIEKDCPWEHNIDYTVVDQIIIKKRNSSLFFLKTALDSLKDRI
ncbi:MAG: polysaccharide pyruvyl transferase family protein [Bacteroidales bacterium]|nr:polysaccharide pyruvyl transferase family protein [Candidatus Physcocola equi]